MTLSLHQCANICVTEASLRSKKSTGMSPLQSLFSLSVIKLSFVVLLLSAVPRSVFAQQVTIFPTGALNISLAVAVDSSFNLYVVNGFPSNSLYVVKLAVTGAEVCRYVPTNPAFYSPSALRLDSESNVYVSDGHNNVVTKFSPSGSQLHVFASSNISGPQGIAFDTAGNLYVGSNDFSLVVKFNPGGQQIDVLSVPDTPLGVAVDGAGQVYIAGRFNGIIYKLSSSGRVLAAFNTTNPSLQTPAGMVFDSAGNLFVADQGNGRVVKFDPNTGAVLAVFNVTNPAMMNWDVAVDTLGNVYTTDIARNGVIVFQFTEPPAPKNNSATHVSTGAALPVMIMSLLLVGCM